MEKVRRREPTPRFGFAGVLIPALLLTMSACTHAAMGGRYGTIIASKEGFDGTLGKNAKTREYFKTRVRFDDGANGHVDANFNSEGREIKVRIEPEGSADYADWFGALLDPLAGGSIVARIQNLENIVVKELGFKKQGDFAYMWVGPLTEDGSKRAVAFYTFDTDDYLDEGPLNPIYAVTRCVDSFGPHRPSVAMKPNHLSAKCRDTIGLGAPQTLSRAAQLVSNTPIHQRALNEQGLWISCSGGCCETGAFY